MIKLISLGDRLHSEVQVNVNKLHIHDQQNQKYSSLYDASTCSSIFTRLVPEKMHPLKIDTIRCVASEPKR